MKLTHFIFEARSTPAAHDPFEELPRAKSDKDHLNDLTAIVSGGQQYHDHLEKKLNDLTDKHPVKNLVRSKWSIPLTDNDYEISGQYGVHKDAPDHIKKMFHKKQRVSNELEQHRGVMQAHNLSILEKEEAAKQARKDGKAEKKSAAYTTGNTIDEADVPDEIDVWKRRIENPYFLTTKERYAGIADAFPFTAKARKNYNIINSAIKRNGIPPFHTLYGSKSTYYGKEFATEAMSMVIIGGHAGKEGGKNSVVWEKIAAETTYRNNIYISGNAVRLDVFLEMSEADQDKLFDAYIP